MLLLLSLLVSIYTLLPMANAEALELCAKVDRRGADPTAPKENSPIKLRALCKPGKEVSLGTTQDLADIQQIAARVGALEQLHATPTPVPTPTPTPAPTENSCDDAVIDVEQGPSVVPRTLLRLDGMLNPPSGETISYLWSAEVPPGAQGTFLPSAQVSSPTFTASVVGTYTFTLSVAFIDGVGGQTDCPLASYVVEVAPTEALYAELVWDTPGDADPWDNGPGAGADMDMHFAHPFACSGDLDNDGDCEPWFDVVFDCYWTNPNPNWGSQDPAVGDDPELVVDDSDGAGPEILQLSQPENNTSYKIGVHYTDDFGYGSSEARVRVWVNGNLAMESSLGGLVKHDLWEVAIIDWQNGTAVVEAIEDQFGGPSVIGGVDPGP